MPTIEHATNVHSIPSEDNARAPVSDVGAMASGPDKLFGWLGSFWSEIYEDDGLVRGIQDARASRLSQIYLDVMEASRLVDRKNAPVFHRERWHPIRVRLSERNTGSAGVLRFGVNSAKFGAQEPGMYPEGTMFTFGSKDAKFKGFVTYPVDCDVAGGAKFIVDGIAGPKVFLRPGMDFMLRGGSLVLRDDMDPFADGSPFPVFEVPGGADGSGQDKESVLWACDAEIERDYVHGHLGYAIGLPPPGEGSSERYKTIVNAVWDTVSEGASPKAFQALVAALCGLPFVLSRNEVVESVSGSERDGWTVVTSGNVYRLPKWSVLARGVTEGAELGRFDLLDRSIHVYPGLVDVDRVAEMQEFDDISGDIPVMDIPPALIRSRVDGGFYVGWGEQPVVCDGFDSNGNPRLRFRLEGSEFDNDTFWRDVWSSCEGAGVPVSKLFGDDVSSHQYVDGEEFGKISPMKFFLRQLVGANTLFVTVKTDAVPPESPLFDPRFFGRVRECVPSGIRLYFVEHCSSDTDGYDLSGDTVSDDGAELDVWEERYDESRIGGKKGFRCTDKVSARLVARCVDKDEYDEY